MTRILPVLAAAAALLLSACGSGPQVLDTPPDALGKMRLGHLAVITDKAVKSPVSRDATPAEWQAVLTKAFQDRFGRLDGERYYHIGIHLDGYAIAPPGVPVLLSPKSVLIISATVFDDAKGGADGGKINEKPRQITVFESFSGETVVGSGLTRTREEQMAALAFNAAKAVEDWMVENPHWFDPAAAPPAEPPKAPSGR
ncbi:hypothetical protein [Ruixingdingia sedimenti]|uniref:Lipoprotein n=1 Tax=Ruixingdingia sedimenti TaxID=3073604 RepID=A0ABU1F9M0_9RHOB|nr:hypothetical protein [Xinfangfangia sp. LG-4]MDR5653571.1 hypothetical protein [Xinfangfangia sp. LG-4]